MDSIYRLTAFWYTRIGAFLLLAALCISVYGWAVGFFNQEIYLLLLVVSLAVEQGRKEGAWYAIGLHYRWALRHIAAGVLLSIGSIACIGGIAVALGADWRMAATLPDWNEVGWRLSMLAWAAAGEELLFRGVVFQALFERFGSVITVACMSLLFSAVHALNPSISALAFANVLLAGTLFSLMYIHTRSLWLPWAFHFGWNAAQHYLLASPVSGWALGYPLLELRSSEGGELYSLVLGNDFGIEGGLATTCILVLVMGVVSLPVFAKVPPELAARLFKRRYAESEIRAAFRFPWRRRRVCQQEARGEGT